MAGTTQATVGVATPAFAKRKARALIGWLPIQLILDCASQLERWLPRALWVWIKLDSR